MITGIGQDIRLAFRSLRATPVVTAVAVASLALAIGANTAVFSILNSLLLRTLPIRQPERLVHVTDSVVTDTGATRIRAWSYPFWEQIRQRPELFERSTAWSFIRFNLASGGETQFVDGLWADGGFFESLAVPVLLGRAFSEQDDQPAGGPNGPVAVIGYRAWKQRFGGGADVIGRSVRLNNVPFTIVGVTPPDFFGPEVGRAFEFVVPLRTEAMIRGRDSVLDSAASNFLTVMARLKPGQTREAAIGQLRSAQPAIREATMGPWESAVIDRYLTSPFTLVPAATGASNLRQNYERSVVTLSIVVAVVLLIGCLNVANLMLARALARRHELSVRVALGASRWQLARQLFTESLVLSGLGAAVGAFIAAWGSEFLVRQLSTPTNVVFLDTSLDGRVLGFTAAVATLTALLCGAAPAFRATRVRPIDALKEKSRAGTERGHGGLMGWLVVGQVALSVVLMVAAGLFIRSFATLATRDLGLQADRVLVATVDPPRALEPLQRVSLYERIREGVLRLPTVAGAAVSHVTPVGGGGFTPAVAFSTGSRVQADVEVFGNLISPGWFGTFGTPLVAGRDFGEGDRRGAPRVAIVNETLARRFFGGTSPIGSELTVYPDSPRALSMQIVGVAGDAIYTSPRDPVPPTWYAPIAQFDVPGFPFATARLSVRAATGSPALLTKSVVAAVEAVNPHVALTFRRLADQIDASLTRERMLAQLSGFFGALALLLAALGLYGVTAYAISRRRVEIGIRLALGGTPAGMIRLMLARASLLIGIGLVAGFGLSIWASTFVARLIHGLPPRDSATLAGAVMLLAFVGTFAAWIPARRAARLDPNTVLREG